MVTIKEIHERNQRVEQDKAWETSMSRKISITLLTYIIMALFLLTIKTPRPWISACIPAIGYFLSTLTLPYFKNLWIKNTYKK
ncbi:MAG: hypothetical protein Q7R96_03655 [Nanoarchaeota archaeon]|nr:hypothetical protein [Nanoarchaeota archaeon]